MAQITLNSSGVASNGSLLLQSNGTTTAVTIDTAQNMGLGVTPSAWDSTYRILQIGGNPIVSGTDQALALTSNAYYNSGWKYVTSGRNAAYYEVNKANGGIHAWYNAASGTAGNTISFNQAMTLDASGNLGVGATSPAVRLDVGGATADVRVAPSTTTNSAYYRCVNASGQAFLGLDNSSGGLGGVYALNIWHSGAYPIALGTNNIERARITSGGSLLVAKTTTNDGDTGFMFEPIRDGAGNGRLTITQSSSTNSGVSFSAYSSGAAAYRFYVGMGGTIFATSTTISAISDIRYKENVRDLNVGLAEVMALKPRLYDWKEGKGADIKNARGFIAQEFEEVFPDLIDEWKDPAPEGEDPYKSVRADLIPVLVKAIQELKAIVDAQAVEIAALKGTA